LDGKPGSSKPDANNRFLPILAALILSCCNSLSPLSDLPLSSEAIELRLEQILLTGMLASGLMGNKDVLVDDLLSGEHHRSSADHGLHQRAQAQPGFRSPDPQRAQPHGGGLSARSPAGWAQQAHPGERLAQNLIAAVLISLMLVSLAQPTLGPRLIVQPNPPGRGRALESEMFGAGGWGGGGIWGTATTLKAIDQRSPSPRNGATEWGCQAGNT
jgi:hypothetical protein